MALTAAQIAAAQQGGLVPYHLVSAASTNATVLKNAPGIVGAVSGFNTNAAPRYLKLYDLTTAPVVGTSVPVQVLMMPGNASGAGFVMPYMQKPIVFTNGIAFALTTGMADGDSTAVGSADCVVNIDYL